MSAPDYVPTNVTENVRTYSSPPSRNRSWMADRPGDIDGAWPTGDRLGVPGPDQGYAIKLASSFLDRLHLGSLDEKDVVAGCVAVANKRSGLFGRAPVVHDLTVAFTIWGFLDESPPAELVEQREKMFPEVASAHHYPERREIADRVSASMLQRPHGAIISDYASDWTLNFV
ncbi:MAG: hypothetical protein HKN03_15780 [Acidimicrobiales bacterium]|nr:hypothetical protein [Acidimicrobiales bacterium]